mgnify:CR=1 FL=1
MTDLESANETMKEYAENCPTVDIGNMFFAASVFRAELGRKQKQADELLDALVCMSIRYEFLGLESSSRIFNRTAFKPIPSSVLEVLRKHKVVKS